MLTISSQSLTHSRKQETKRINLSTVCNYLNIGHKMQLNQEWRQWVTVNIARGSDLHQLYQILLEQGFDRDTITAQIGYSPLPKHHFSREWKTWLEDNIAAGVDKQTLFKICLDEGFSYSAIETNLKFTPEVDLASVSNPLSDTETPINAIDISRLHVPNAKSYQSGSLNIFVVDKFLNKRECQQLESELARRMTETVLSGLQYDEKIEIGGSCLLDGETGNMFGEIDQRLCKLIAIHPSHGEPLRGEIWSAEQNNHLYLKALETAELNPDSSQPGDRIYAVSVYLNDTSVGGETDFINTDISLEPRAGMAVIWSNTDSQGAPLHQSLRRTQPVLKGHKAVLTKWFRSHCSNSNRPLSFNRDANEIIPAYTKAGFCKRVLPSRLFTKITDFYTDNSASIAEETVEGGYIQSGKNSTANGSSLIDLTTDLRREIHDELKAGMEQWSGVELLPTYVYGIRIYHRGAVLRPHRDRLATHIIGAIINVAQDVDEDWPLEIYDHQHRKHEVILKPGEMIFYESGSLIHGRSTPLKGNAFANIFCHCKPVDYEPTPVLNG